MLDPSTITITSGRSENTHSISLGNYSDLKNHDFVLEFRMKVTLIVDTSVTEILYLGLGASGSKDFFLINVDKNSNNFRLRYHEQNTNNGTYIDISGAPYTSLCYFKFVGGMYDGVKSYTAYYRKSNKSPWTFIVSRPASNYPDMVSARVIMLAKCVEAQSLVVD